MADNLALVSEDSRLFGHALLRTRSCGPAAEDHALWNSSKRDRAFALTSARHQHVLDLPGPRSGTGSCRAPLLRRPRLRGPLTKA
jgi:hypothetical protein